jgi:signal transduction histidine kinase
VTAGLGAEVAHLRDRLGELKTGGGQGLPLEEIEANVSALTASLARLQDLVSQRLETRERLSRLRHGVFAAKEKTQRLLAPWLQVLDAEIAALVEERAAGRIDGDRRGELASLIELQGLARSAQAKVANVADIMAEAFSTERVQRLPVLSFQLGLALSELEATAAKLDPKLRPLLLERLAELRSFAEGADAIAEARAQELALVSEGEHVLAVTGRLSAELTDAVDRLGSAAKQDIGEATRAALAVQRLSTRALIVLVALSLVTSILIVWFYVGRNIVRRLTALSDGMLAIAGGRLETPVAVEGTDEIAAMARAVEIFRRNSLERDGLALASKYKSQFLAAASHDLRQPLHALNLFVAQLRRESDPAESRRLVTRITAAVGSMNELFEALLDMSKLDSGLLEPNVSDFPVQPLLTRIETTFTEVARKKGLRLTVVPNSAWVRSDFILLERILLNLVSNGLRYTAQGGVVVGCRRRGGGLRIDVCDSGPGIPEDQQRTIFGEFVQLPSVNPDSRSGRGLGLSIVERLGRLLDHPVTLSSRVGKGSRFSISVPEAVSRGEAAEAPAALAPIANPVRGKRIAVIDDDALVLDGMGGILRSWGCEVIAAESGEAALTQLTAQSGRPDLIISDDRLANGRTGIEAIELLRRELGAAIPAFLISGDTTPARMRQAHASNYPLLYKPVAPMRLRAMLHELLRARDGPPTSGGKGEEPASRRHSAAQRPAPRP